MILDFEKPIKLLNDKLSELKDLYQQTEDASLQKTIETLSEKIKTLTQETFLIFLIGKSSSCETL